MKSAFNQFFMFELYILKILNLLEASRLHLSTYHFGSWKYLKHLSKNKAGLQQLVFLQVSNIFAFQEKCQKQGSKFKVSCELLPILKSILLANVLAQEAHSNFRLKVHLLTTVKILHMDLKLRHKVNRAKNLWILKDQRWLYEIHHFFLLLLGLVMSGCQARYCEAPYVRFMFAGGSFH